MTRAIREPGRVAAVHRAGLMGTPPEACFDRVTRLPLRSGARIAAGEGR